MDSSAGGQPALKPHCFTLPLLPAGGLGGAIPTSDPYETGFTTGQRNIFRQAFQKRADASLVKVTHAQRAVQPEVHLRRLQPDQHHQLRYSGQRGLAKRSTTTPFQQRGTTAAAHRLHGQRITDQLELLCCPSGLGIVTHTIGSPRQIQMSLHLRILEDWPRENSVARSYVIQANRLAIPYGVVKVTQTGPGPPGPLPVESKIARRASLTSVARIFNIDG